MKLLADIGHLYRHYRATTGILKRVLKDPLGVEESRTVIEKRMRERTKNFLEMIEQTIYGHADSPYRLLLERAGYRFEDVRRLVMTRGIEDTLSALHDDGVYVDILEFKGKKPAVRGSDTYSFRERDFSNPLLTRGMGTRSGGTRSDGTRIVVPLEFIEEHNSYGVVAAHEYGIMDNPVIIWLPILPAGEGLFFSLRFAAMGNPPVKWFSQVDSRHIKPSGMDRLKTRTTILMARFYRKKMAAPEFIEMRRTDRIAKWMHENRGNSKGFTVITYASSALRLVMEARKGGFDLGQTVFWTMGEPLTAKITGEMADIGCRAYALYGCNELMIIGQGCADPGWPDDMHLCKDKLAVIQRSRKVDYSDAAVDAFFFTTILKSSPKIFLNTETGDFGSIEKRNCGCAFEQLGFTEHIHTVRSFEKLTAEGASFVGSDLIPLIQSVLPDEFGGDATDYQFVEEEDEEGIPRLYILISPGIGEVDEKRVLEMIFDGLTSGEYAHSYSRSYWDQVGTVRIRRIDPIPTKRGKIVPLLIRRKEQLK